MALCVATVMAFILFIVSLSLVILLMGVTSYSNLIVDYFFEGGHFSNISLYGNAKFYLRARFLYDCSVFEAHWEIQRADGEAEVYTVLNETYYYGRYDHLPDKGLSFSGYCFAIDCYLQMELRPKDLTYNGAQITGVLNLPECFNSSNITDPMTLNIQGTILKL